MHALQEPVVHWIKPPTTSLALGTLDDLTRGKAELLAEHARLATPTDDPPSTDQTTCLPEDRSVAFGAASQDGSDLETGAFSCPAGDALAASIVTSSVGFGNTHRKGI